MAKNIIALDYCSFFSAFGAWLFLTDRAVCLFLAALRLKQELN